MWLSGNTGVIIPKGSEFQRRVRQAQRKIAHDLGTDTLVKMYKEKGVYNTYVWLDEVDGSAKKEPQDLNSGASVEVSSSSGNSRRAQP